MIPQDEMALEARDAIKPKSPEEVGHWEALINTTVEKFGNQSPEWWAGFIEGVIERYSLPLSVEHRFEQPTMGYTATEF